MTSILILSRSLTTCRVPRLIFHSLNSKPFFLSFGKNALSHQQADRVIQLNAIKSAYGLHCTPIENCHYGHTATFDTSIANNLFTLIDNQYAILFCILHGVIGRKAINWIPIMRLQSAISGKTMTPTRLESNVYGMRIKLFD